MGRKDMRQAIPLKDYESVSRSDSYIRLCKKVTHSKAYQEDLTYRERDLYRVCREQFNYKLRRKDCPANDFPDIKEYRKETVFYLTPEYLERHEHSLYRGKKGYFDAKAFHKSMRKLHDLGFIKILYRGGRGKGDKAVYELSLDAERLGYGKHL